MFKCDICGFQTTSAISYSMHIDIHSDLLYMEQFKEVLDYRLSKIPNIRLSNLINTLILPQIKTQRKNKIKILANNRLKVKTDK
jgi:hypothetical protein